MRDLMEHRRETLAAELEKGERLLGELESRRNDLRASVLRISGAMQVLDELLAADAASHPAEPQLHRAAAG
jgi:hypothetical protein